MTCDAMVIPVVTGDIDPGAVEDLIALCVRYHQIRTQRPRPRRRPRAPAGPASTGTQDGAGTQDGTARDPAAGTATPGGAPVPAGLTGTAARHAAAGRRGRRRCWPSWSTRSWVRSCRSCPAPAGPRRSCAGTCSARASTGPSLPLDVGQTDDIPLHLRRLVTLRDQRCQFPGGCDQPASGCEPHHVTHRHDGGHTSLTNLKDYCWWHHHVVLHQLGWTLTAHPDGTSQVQSPDGKIIHSHSPPPRPG